MKQRVLTELLQEAHPGYDPVRALADIASNPKVDLAIRVQCHKAVAKYVRSALKSVEFNSTESDAWGPPKIVINVVKPGDADIDQ